jgi:hypothetical protein
VEADGGGELMDFSEEGMDDIEELPEEVEVI